MRLWLSRRLENIALVAPGTGPRRSDWVITALLVVSLPLEGFSFLAWPTIQTLAALLAIGLIPFRRVIPLQAALTAFLAVCAIDIAGWQFHRVVETSFGHLIAGLLLIYALCRWADPARTLIGLLLTLSMVAVGELAAGSSRTDIALSTVLWFILASFALAMRYRARLKAECDNSIRLAERNALARDLHDTVAHHVTAIAVQAQAARFVAPNDPDAAVRAIANIEEIANKTIDEMRRMVGILRTNNDRDRVVAATNLAEVNEPGATPTATFPAETSLEHLPTSIAAAVFRIAQEAVTNARRHSRRVTFIEVELATDRYEVALTVTNDGAPTNRNSGSGYGLVGMHERVEALGGTLSSAARPTTGWRVQAVLPIERPA